MTPQEKALEVMGSVLDVITFAVGALGGISLLVGGVGILTIMTMAVTERTHREGDHARHRTQHLQRLLLRDQGEVLAPMPILEQRRDGAQHTIQIGVGLITQVDLHQPRAIK